MPEEEATWSKAASKLVYIRGEVKAIGWRVCLPSWKKPIPPSPVPAVPQSVLKIVFPTVTDCGWLYHQKADAVARGGVVARGNMTLCKNNLHIQLLGLDRFESPLIIFIQNQISPAPPNTTDLAIYVKVPYCNRKYSPKA